MNIPIEQFGASGVTALGGLITAITMWNKFQNKVENLEKTDIEQDREMKAFWKWKDEHEKDSSSTREEFTKEIARLEGSTLVVGEQYKAIISMLQDIKDRISKLESMK